MYRNCNGAVMPRQNPLENNLFIQPKIVLILWNSKFQHFFTKAHHCTPIMSQFNPLCRPSDA
jgi:hypothetical protein